MDDATRKRADKFLPTIKPRVRLQKVSEKEDAVIIDTRPEKKHCRKCKAVLEGGEVDFGVCDSCNDE